ncbi:MAG: SCP2 sterol-binding domain-containing protein [Pseudomonadales bacterium]|nr:SCP2 sterol-binding domain-containing protein [Pseudomonadales bacterium]
MSDQDKYQDPRQQNRSLLPSMVTGQLEAALNRALSYAPATKMRLKRLAGKSLGLKLRNPMVEMTILIERKGVRVLSHLEENPNAVIEGSFFTVMRNLAKETSTGQWLASGVKLEGDVELIQQLSTILAEQDFDVEELLSELFGDIAAHQITRATRGAFSFLKKAGKALIEESGVLLNNSEGTTLVEKQEAQSLFEQVDTLRDDYDRLEARWNQIEAKLKARSESNLSPNTPTPQS